jgi:hypothetical protein
VNSNQGNAPKNPLSSDSAGLVILLVVVLLAVLVIAICG